MAYLHFEKGRKRYSFELEEKSVLVGRSKSCGLVLEDPQVSREHAQIVRRSGGYYILDLGSRHGTYVNGHRIEELTRLEENDVIVICDDVFTFRGAPAGQFVPEADDDFLSVEDMAEEVHDEQPIIMSTVDATIAGEQRPEVGSEAKLRAILEINRSIQSSLRVDDLLSRILESLFRIFPQAQRGCILLFNDNNRLVPRATMNRDRTEDPKVRISTTIIDRALADKHAILSADAGRDNQFALSQSISSLGIRSILCAPLVNQDNRPLGIIQVHSEEYGKAFTEEDLNVIAIVASTTAMALENVRLNEEQVKQEKILRETELARDVQRRFLPPSMPRVPGYVFWGYYESARSVGGDYYGFIDLPEDRLAIALGDVSGKGMPAAMLMARLSSDVRFSTMSTPGPAEALQSVNRSLAEAEMEDKFVTLVLMLLDRRRHVLTVANAGHMSPLLRRPDGTLEEIGDGISGLPLNVSFDRDYEYEAVSVSLEPGSSVLVYSDGVSEARNSAGEMFGLEALSERFRTGSPDPAAAGKSLVEAVVSFAGGEAQHDDMTLVCFGRESDRAVQEVTPRSST